jgi:hypothetical protein
MVAASGAVMFLLVSTWSRPRTAWMLTAIYVAGTSSFSQSSQALWQHGASQLALSMALLALVRRGRHRAWAPVAGATMAMAVACRPVDVLLVIPMFLSGVASMPRSVWRMAAGALPVVLAQIWYNQHYFGDALHLQWPVADAANWSTPLLAGLAGLLFSPGRGLFVYSPVLAGAAVGAYRAWTRPGWDLMRWMSIGVVATILLVAKWSMWWGGACYGHTRRPAARSRAVARAGSRGRRGKRGGGDSGVGACRVVDRRTRDWRVLRRHLVERARGCRPQPGAALVVE